MYPFSKHQKSMYFNSIFHRIETEIYLLCSYSGVRIAFFKILTYCHFFSYRDFSFSFGGNGESHFVYKSEA